MANPVVHLTFTDGSKQSAPLNPRIMVEVERKFGGNIPAIEGMLYGAWVRLGRPGPFEEWLDTVDAVEDEADEADPTQPEASADS